jgi:hypothetical protein
MTYETYAEWIRASRMSPVTATRLPPRPLCVHTRSGARIMAIGSKPKNSGKAPSKKPPSSIWRTSEVDTTPASGVARADTSKQTATAQDST